MPFDWLVTGQVVPVNPAHSVRGPRHSVTKGIRPVLSSEEATALLAGMDTSSVVGLRDRAMIAVMTYTFARVGALIALNVGDYYSQKKRWWLRLHEKNGKLNEMPCHHKLKSFFDAYIDAACVDRERQGPLFRAAIGKTKKLGPGRMSRKDVWCIERKSRQSTWWMGHSSASSARRHAQGVGGDPSLAVDRWKWKLLHLRLSVGPLVASAEFGE
jgi:site-specific recombinase XerC